MARRQYKLDRRDRLKPKPPFTPENLRAVVSDALGERYVPPGAEEARVLCRILNGWHAFFYDAQQQREFNTAVDEAASAIETLQRVLPLISKRRLAEAERGGQFSKWMADAAVELYQAINKNAARITHRESLHAKDWRWLAEVLPVDIGNAMRPANPRWPAGHSKRGPLSKILAAIIPRMSGEHPTAIAIGNQFILLAKNDREGETG